MNILVTGGAGFIGSYLVKGLLQQGHHVTVLDNFSRGKPENLSALESDQLKIKNVDLTNEALLKEFMKSYDIFFHLAAINGTGYFYSKPDQVLDINTMLMINTVKQAIQHKVGRFVFFSSSEAYHLPPTIPTPETVPLIVPDIKNPRFSYSVSKIIGEAYCHHYLKNHGVDFTIIRPHNFYGPKMGFKHVIPEIAAKCLRAGKNGTLEIQGTGEETRTFCYIDDAINGIISAATSSSAANEIVHIGRDDEEIAIKDLIHLIIKKLNRNDLSIKTTPLLEGSVQRRCPDVSKARTLFGYDPKINLSSGLDKTLNWVTETQTKGEKIEE